MRNGERMLPVIDLTVFTKILYQQKPMKSPVAIPALEEKFAELQIFLGRIFFYSQLNKYICDKFNKLIIMEDINRIKIVLVEKKRTGKWLAEQLGKNPSTISKWCSNVAQPDLATLVKIATLLEVGVQDLFVSTK